MPQLVPFYYLNQITFAFIFLIVMIYIFSKYIFPRFVGLFNTRWNAPITIKKTLVYKPLVKKPLVKKPVGYFVIYTSGLKATNYHFLLKVLSPNLTTDLAYTGLIGVFDKNGYEAYTWKNFAFFNSKSEIQKLLGILTETIQSVDKTPEKVCISLNISLSDTGDPGIKPLIRRYARSKSCDCSSAKAKLFGLKPPKQLKKRC